MSNKTIISFLKFSCFLVFAGRAYQHLFWDAPFRSLLWDQALLEPIITGFFNMQWQDYVTDLEIDNTIQSVIRGHGVFYTICAFIALLIHPYSKKWMKLILTLGGISLVLLSILLTKEKFYHLAMFFEHAIQFSIPFVLLYFMKNSNTDRLISVLKVIIALTFTCHGLYALGTIYPLPANFVTMTLNILPVSEPTAKSFLFIAAILDFLVAILIFIPKTAKPALLYAAVWGLLTALARIVNGLSYDISLATLHQYLYPTIYRVPHGLIPLLVYLLIKRKSSNLQFTNSLNTAT